MERGLVLAQQESGQTTDVRDLQKVQFDHVRVILHRDRASVYNGSAAVQGG